MRLVAVRGHALFLLGLRHLRQRRAGLGRRASGQRGKRPAPGVRSVRRLLILILLAAPSLVPAAHARDSTTVLPDSVQQGALVFGQTAPGSRVTLHGKALRVAP